MGPNTCYHNSGCIELCVCTVKEKKFMRQPFSNGWIKINKKVQLITYIGEDHVNEKCVKD